MTKKSLILFLPLLGMIAFAGSCALNPIGFDENDWRARVKAADPALLYAPHYENGRFFNPWMPQEQKSFLTLLRWKLTRSQPYTEEERTFVPGIAEKAKERIQAMPEGDFILWVGHGTFLFRLNGVYWLVDPIFSERALLPKRKTPPGIALKDLKEIAPNLKVIITHNHYDHLDKGTILDLPENTKIYAPLGLKPYLRGLNKKQVTEMDWWQEIETGRDVTLVCLPAQHWSRRIGQGFNETLWASFMLVTPEVKIYLGGDSGYFVGYREIGKHFPGIDYALLPTTAYHPRWFMHYNHTSIDETIQAYHDLNARFMIPQQWGTFHLGDEPPGYPALDLKRKITDRRLDSSRFILMDIGEILAIGNKRASGSP
jgi:N-acyl-phosphatidylethanolamine-hydrolysing phospholipase D